MRKTREKQDLRTVSDVTTSALEKDLQAFVATHSIRGKGALCVMLVVNDHAKAHAEKRAHDPLMGPLLANDLLTEKGGQVLDLGKAKVQSILKRHEIDRVLAEEGGRTSRGSIANMRVYVEFLNNQAKKCHGKIDLEDAERFWIGEVRKFFAGKPFVLKLDPAWGVRASIRELMDQAEKRQKEATGTMFLGTMLQHLVGAKLKVFLGESDGKNGAGLVQDHSANQSDQSPDRHGDFDLNDVAIHVSTAPSQGLIEKCAHNLEKGKRPIIITTKVGAVKADVHLDEAGLSNRVDVIEFEQFIAANVFELGNFNAEGRRATIQEIVEAYNAIVDKVETDPSLMIKMTAGK